MSDDSIFFGESSFDTLSAPPPVATQHWASAGPPPSFTVFTPHNPTSVFGPPGQRLGEGTDFDSEPPLLEELGINFDHIKKKTVAVLNPFTKRLEPEILTDCDMAGPIVFGLLLGFSQTLMGKWTFDYIYGFGCVGCISIYLLVNLMSTGEQIDMYRTVSILGYCLLPMVFLSVSSIALSTQLSVFLALACITWCTRSSVMMFTEPNMHNQRYLVAYPVALFYSCFALLTVF